MFGWDDLLSWDATQVPNQNDLRFGRAPLGVIPNPWETSPALSPNVTAAPPQSAAAYDPFKALGRSPEKPKAEPGVLGNSFGVLNEDDQQKWLKDQFAAYETGQKRITSLEARRAAASPSAYRGIDAILRNERAALPDINKLKEIEGGFAPLPTKTGLRAAAENAPRGFAESVLSIPQFAGIVKGYIGDEKVDDNALLKWSQDAKKSVAGMFPGDAARQNDFEQQLANGLGQLASFYGGGALAALAKAGPKAMAAVVALQGGAASGSGGFEEATQKLKEARDEVAMTGDQAAVTELDRILQTFGYAAVGTTEAIPIASTLGRVVSEPAGRLGRRVLSGAESGLEEAAQEAGSQVAQNLIAGQTTDPNRAVGEGVTEGAAVGGTLGAGMGFLLPGKQRPVGTQERGASEFTPEVQALYGGQPGEPVSFIDLVPGEGYTEVAPQAALEAPRLALPAPGEEGGAAAASAPSPAPVAPGGAPATLEGVMAAKGPELSRRGFLKGLGAAAGAAMVPAQAAKLLTPAPTAALAPAVPLMSLEQILDAKLSSLPEGPLRSGLDDMLNMLSEEEEFLEAGVDGGEYDVIARPKSYLKALKEYAQTIRAEGGMIDAGYSAGTGETLTPEQLDELDATIADVAQRFKEMSATAKAQGKKIPKGRAAKTAQAEEPEKAPRNVTLAQLEEELTQNNVKYLDALAKWEENGSDHKKWKPVNDIDRTSRAIMDEIRAHPERQENDHDIIKRAQGRAGTMAREVQATKKAAKAAEVEARRVVEEAKKANDLANKIGNTLARRLTQEAVRRAWPEKFLRTLAAKAESSPQEVEAFLNQLTPMPTALPAPSEAAVDFNAVPTEERAAEPVPVGVKDVQAATRPQPPGENATKLNASAQKGVPDVPAGSVSSQAAPEGQEPAAAPAGPTDRGEPGSGGTNDNGITTPTEPTGSVNLPGTLSAKDILTYTQKFTAAGRAVNLPSELTQPMLDVSEEYKDMLPADTSAAVLTRIEPAGFDKAGKPLIRTVFTDTNGDQETFIDTLKAIESLQAFFHPVTGGLYFLILDPGETSRDRLTAKLWHESLHAIRSKGQIPANDFARLLGHAEDLRVLDLDYNEYADVTKDPNAGLYAGKPKEGGEEGEEVPVTIRELYADLYRDIPHIEELLNQEAVAHLLELYVHGVLKPEHVAPIQDVLDALASGQYGRNAAAATGVGAETTAPSEAGYASTVPEEGKPLANDQGFTLRVPYREEWGNPRQNPQDKQRALEHIDALAQLDPRTTPLEELLQGREDMRKIIANLFFYAPDVTEQQITNSDEIWYYTIEKLEKYPRTGEQLGRSSLLNGGADTPEEVKEIAAAAREVVDKWLTTADKRKGLADLIEHGTLPRGKAPVKPKADPERIGDARGGFFFKAARALDALPEALFAMGGQAVVNALEQAGVKRAEIKHFGLDKMAHHKPAYRDDFKQKIAQRIFEFRRKTSWLNPERSPGHYGDRKEEKTRAFQGPRVPGRGVYFERLIAFPKKLKGGEEFMPGNFVSPHWDEELENAWASWRGSVREVPDWGTMVLGEEGQSDYMQGANTKRRPRISQEEFAELKGRTKLYEATAEKAESLIRQIAFAETTNFNNFTSLRSGLVGRATFDPMGWKDSRDDLWRFVTNIEDPTKRTRAAQDFNNFEKLVKEYPWVFEKGAFQKYAMTDSDFTSATPIDDSYVRTMVRDLLLQAAAKKADSIAVATTETNDRIQANTHTSAGHFYDQQVRPALQKELRRLTGDGSLTLERVALPKAQGAPRNEKAFTAWAAKLPKELVARIKKEGLPVFARTPDKMEPVEKDALGYYSRAWEATKANPRKSGTGASYLNDFAKAGVTKNEMAAIGLDKFLASKPAFTKDEIVDFVKRNQVRLGEQVFGGEEPPHIKELKARQEAMSQASRGKPSEVEWDAEEWDRLGDEVRAYDRGKQQTRWSDWSLDKDNPTYKETVLTLPGKFDKFVVFVDGHQALPHFFDTAAEARAAGKSMGLEGKATVRQVNEPSDIYRHSHWQFVDNPVAHIRSQILADTQGRRVFNIDELQSDWGQNIRDNGGEGITPERKTAAKKKLEDAEGAVENAAKAARAALTSRPELLKPQIGETAPYGEALMGISNPEGKANWDGRYPVSGVMTTPVRIGDLRGSVTYWPEHYSWNGDPKGPLYVASTQDGEFAGAHASSMEKAILRLRGHFSELPLEGQLKLVADGANLNGDDAARDVLEELGRTLQKLRNDKMLANAEYEGLLDIPPAHPLVNETSQWVATTMRRALQQAVDSGAEGISFTPGSVVAKRFGKSFAIGSVMPIFEDWLVLGGEKHRQIKLFDRHGDEIYLFEVNPEGTVLKAKSSERDEDADGFKGRPLSLVLGKELAERTMAARSRSEIDAEGYVAGEASMKAFYDKMYPEVLSKMLKKLDPSIKPEKVRLNPKKYSDDVIENDFLFFPLTELAKTKLREQGQPLFSARPPLISFEDLIPAQ